MKQIYVINNNMDLSTFKPKMIKQYLLDNTQLSEEECKKIAKVITNQVYDKFDKEVTTTILKSLVLSNLIKRGEVKEAEDNTMLGMTIKDFENLLQDGNKSNANHFKTAEQISHYAWETIGKQYALQSMPEDVKESYLEGRSHIHDLATYNIKSNCMIYDPRFFLKNGLKIDGNGINGSVAGSAKSLKVLLNHLQQVFMAGACCLSGGQAINNFNTFLAPLCKGLSYKEIKQEIQGFIYNCNMSLLSRGGQLCFTSIHMDLKIPYYLKDKPAVSFGGNIEGVYGDYEEEFDKIFKAVCEVSIEGDASGQWHRFPNIVYTFNDKSDLDKYEGNVKLLHELGVENTFIYYCNSTNDISTSMGCLAGSEGIWTRQNNEIEYYTFEELSDKFNCDYGVTDISEHNLEVLTIDDNRNIIWHKITNFIKNKDRLLYKVYLNGNKSFICDDLHEMITYNGMNGINVLDATKGSNLLDVSCKETMVSITKNKDYYAGVLYGFYLSDGVKNKNYNLIIVSKEDKKNYIIDLFEELGIDYKITVSERPEYGENYKEHKFWFKQTGFKVDYENINQLAGILSGMLSSDGYVRTNGEYNNSVCAEWVTTEKKHSELFKWCCFNLGIKFSSRWICPNKTDNKSFERIYLSCNESSVYLLKQLDLRTQQSEILKKVSSDMYRSIKHYKGQRVKNISLHSKGDSYCIEVNDRMIFGEDFILSKQCRTRLSNNGTGDFEKDIYNTGNFMYNTINLPMLACESEDVDDFYKQLDYECELVYKSLKHRRSEVEKALFEYHLCDFLLQKDKDTGEPLYDLDRLTYTIGFIGLNEASLVLWSKEVNDNLEECEKIIKFINNKKDEFKNRDGLRWSVIGSAAENACHTLCKKTLEKYPNCPHNGSGDSVYFTNSSHVNVADTQGIGNHLKNSDIFHPLTGAGNILHIFLGEVYSDPEALFKLNQKILETGTIFWSYTKDYTICRSCNFHINEMIDECPICLSHDVDVYTKITGYMTPIDCFNKGKRQEVDDRTRFGLND